MKKTFVFILILGFLVQTASASFVGGTNATSSSTTGTSWDVIDFGTDWNKLRWANIMAEAQAKRWIPRELIRFCMLNHITYYDWQFLSNYGELHWWKISDMDAFLDDRGAYKLNKIQIWDHVESIRLLGRKEVNQDE